MTKIHPSLPELPIADSAWRHMLERGVRVVVRDPNTGFPGMGDNDWERYAGLASGVMGRLERLPDYVARFYEGLFDTD